MNPITLFMMLFALAVSLPVYAAPHNLFMYTKRMSDIAHCIEVGTNQGEHAADALTCENVLHRRNMKRGSGAILIPWKRGDPSCPAGELQDKYNEFYDKGFNNEFDERYLNCSSSG